MKILIVGSNPSRLNEDPSVPFVGSRSEPLLREWLQALGAHEYDFVNASDLVVGKGEVVTLSAVLKTANYDRLLEKATAADKVLALGAAASAACAKIDLEHFRLPHPSPLNRQINDGKFISTVLKQAKSYIES